MTLFNLLTTHTIHSTFSLNMASNKVSTLLMFFLSFFPGSLLAISANNFFQDVDLIWGGDRAKIRQGGTALSLTLDEVSGSGFQSKNTYLFGRIDMEIKLVPGNSAGTVTAYYLSSLGQYHDEIDFEFLGNLSGDPYTVHTNVYTQGRGDREQQFHLWFDPTKHFHSYSIVWNPKRIIFLIDNIPIRVYENEESIGVPFPKNQAMRLYSSLWDADQWATRGGLIKTDWSQAPFIAHYRNFKADACVWSSSSASFSCNSKVSSGHKSNSSWQNLGLDFNGRKWLRWVQKYYMIYNYCSDVKRFPQGRPRECRHTRFL